MAGNVTDIGDLFASRPEPYEPRRPAHFGPKRIVLAKGSLDTPERRRTAERICKIYPNAEVRQEPDRPHNRIRIGRPGTLESHYEGKRTLVFGEHNSAVRLSDEQGNTCPNYWHFSPYGFCPYDCRYCYLAGTPGVRFSPAVKVFLNLPDILAEIDKTARKPAVPTAFYLGKLQDGLALDPLTGYSRTLVPFFAHHPYARFVLLTKAADVANLLDLDHRGRTILSWSLNPPEVVSRFEANVPSVQQRIAAMRECAAAGYPVRAVIMPIIPVSGWAEAYDRFLGELLSAVPLQRITLGGVCSYPDARRMMEAKMGRGQAITAGLSHSRPKDSDGRIRYPVERRVEIYGRLIRRIREHPSPPEVGLCLEEHAVFQALEMESALGRCNCVL